MSSVESQRFRIGKTGKRGVTNVETPDQYRGETGQVSGETSTKHSELRAQHAEGRVRPLAWVKNRPEKKKERFYWGGRWGSGGETGEYASEEEDADKKGKREMASRFV